jgi:predicted  nucleic acid-binding Zn-ribbon protein
LREQLVLLLSLQTSDAKVRELEAAVVQLPAKLDPLRRDLAKLQGMLDVERAKVAEAEVWRKNQEQFIERESEALKAAKNKLQASKNSREFGAATREIENKRKMITDREQELKKVVEATVATTGALGARDKDVEALRTQLADSEAAIADQLNSLKAQLAEAITTRDAARGQVDKAMLKTYDTLAAKRGFAVAPVVKGVCQGCHIAVPPQFNNVLAKMESIETCPRCGRLVYRKELLEPPVAPDGAATPTV